MFLADTILKDPSKSLQLPDDEVTFVKAIKGSRLSWYRIDRVKAGIEMDLTDLFTNVQITVREYQASKSLVAGTALLGRVVTAFGVSGLVGIYPYCIPPRYHEKLLSLHDELPQIVAATAEEEKYCEESVEHMVRRVEFIKLANHAVGASQQPPDFRNTDSDPLEFREVSFALHGCSLEDCLRRLQPMIEEDGAMAVRDVLNGIEVVDGKSRATFSWSRRGNAQNPGWSSTAIARVTVTAEQVTAEVNSRKRAQLVRERLSTLLGEQIEFLADDEVHPTENSAGQDTKSISMEELPPEVQDQIRDMAKAHWENWFDTPVPMLARMTPREAAKSARGRELLTALFHEYESNMARAKGDNFFQPDIEELKTRLGLTDAN